MTASDFQEEKKNKNFRLYLPCWGDIVLKSHAPNIMPLYFCIAQLGWRLNEWHPVSLQIKPLNCRGVYSGRGLNIDPSLNLMSKSPTIKGIYDRQPQLKSKCVRQTAPAQNQVCTHKQTCY